MVGIPRVPEPRNIKRYFQSRLATDYEVTVATIKQGTWFTKEYYNSFKKELNQQGVKWQDLMEAYGAASYAFIEWVKGKRSWNEALNVLERKLNEVLQRKKKN